MADSDPRTPQSVKFPIPNSKQSKVRVVVRVRPLLARHNASKIGGSEIPCVSVFGTEEHESVSVHLKDQESSRNECYKVDGFFGQEEDNLAEIFDKEVSGLIPGVFQGFNATVFAYGATGSGKTYTMQGTDEHPGLMMRAMVRILSMCEFMENKIEISYFEVYLDRCYDLLEVKVKEINVLEDKDGQLHMKGLSCVPVSSMEEFQDVLSRGVQRRKVAHTDLNDVSSRSHGVLVISVSGSSNTICGKLNLIDLAGNEDNRLTCNEGIRLQESSKINQSLFALSNVIYALNNNQSRIPYRESKLTRILQDSLGGTSRVLMVTCLNPGEYQESVRTVSLAARSRQITNFVPTTSKLETPKPKVDMEAKLRDWLQSKWKSKSAQKIVAFGSPVYYRAPGTVGPFKKHTSVHGSAIPNATTNGRLKSASQRKLFNVDFALSSSTDASSTVSKSTMAGRLKSATQKKTSSVHFAASSCTGANTMVSKSTVDGRLKCAPQKLFNIDFPLSSCTEGNNPQTDEENNDQLGTRNDDFELHSSEVSKAREIKEDKSFESLMNLRTCIPDVVLYEEEEVSACKTMNVNGSSPPSIPKSKTHQMLSPQRKALSDIDSNISRIPLEDVSMSEQEHPLWLLETTPPESPLVVTRDNLQEFGSAMDKFQARSTNVKSFLLDEYVDFLNTATREELVALKGIGPKRADYIMELREASPLKSLSDLQNIGLSLKQVRNLFGSAARGIFG